MLFYEMFENSLKQMNVGAGGKLETQLPGAFLS